MLRPLCPDAALRALRAAQHTQEKYLAAAGECWRLPVIGRLAPEIRS
jgi:hypothetical protein